jgi:alpha-amylase/alpha-mannosidase (GH57 family)
VSKLFFVLSTTTHLKGKLILDFNKEIQKAQEIKDVFEKFEMSDAFHLASRGMYLKGLRSKQIIVNNLKVEQFTKENKV